ncbi:murein biosynthesis integral membrane protein MurJ [Phycisphaerales bacterium AB-hyl4]|uniref:Probable lipid II flippase MurJ n=1 Tax=Natronomicrosphaera hydrolytica TaxID=3242702 RepID=A0ABV4U5J0_9BACT
MTETVETTSRDADAADAGSDAGDGGFVGSAMLVSLMTLLSRITGLVRDAVLAAVFGLSAIADAFFVGFLVPNLFRRLFGEGALSAAFIPHYTDLLKRDPELAKRFASLCLGLLTVLLVGITLLGELALAGLLAAREWTDTSALAIRLTMLMLPYMPLICLVALIGGVLHVHGRFGPPAAAPLLLNIVMIAAAAWAAWGAGGDSVQVAFIVAYGVLLAGVLQLVWQVAVLLRCTKLTATFAGTWPALRSTLVMLLPMLIGLAVFQINAFLDSLIAIGLSPREGAETFRVFGRDMRYPIETGSVAALQWAQRLYQFPLGVFGIAVATAIFPALAAAAATKADGAMTDNFRKILRHGLQLTVFIGLPASVGLLILREPVTRLIYERGAFATDDAIYVATILAGYAASVWAYSMMHVLTRAFYAMKDSRTPLRIGLSLVGFNLGLNLVLIWPLGAAGLAWSTAISAAMQVVLLLWCIRRYVDHPIDANVWRSWGRTASLSAIMAAVLLPMLWLLDTSSMTTGPLALAVFGLVAMGMGIMLGGAWLLKADELRWLIKRRAT